MMTDPKISKMNHLMMTQLATVYNTYSDRISRDSSSLLVSPMGSNLDPVVSQIYENDGRVSPPLLMFNGTIAMPYRGNTYNIPVNIYLPKDYPVRPPVAYVRPTNTMMVKQGHPHVAQSDGKIYMPYLHQWNPGYNLIDLVINMSSLFSVDPPVVSKPVQPPSYYAATNSYTQPPPAYQQQQHHHQQMQQQAEEEMRLAQELSRREEEEQRLKREAERLKQQEERIKQEEEFQKKKMLEFQEKILKEKKMELNTKISSRLYHYENVAKQETYACLFDMVKMERAAETVLSDDHPDSQRKLLQEQKQTLEKHKEELQTQTGLLKDFVEKLKTQKQGDGNGSKTPESADHIAVPDNIHSRQMLELSAENAAISDLMYFLDRALSKGTIPLDVHLKQIRRLAKKQFLARAHLLKVGAVVTTETSKSQRHLQIH